MTKKQLALFMAIMVISASSYAFIPLAISTALNIASKAPSLISNAKNVWSNLSTSGKVAVSIAPSGVLSLSELSSLFPVSEGVSSPGEPVAPAGWTNRYNYTVTGTSTNQVLCAQAKDRYGNCRAWITVWQAYTAPDNSAECYVPTSSVFTSNTNAKGTNNIYSDSSQALELLNANRSFCPPGEPSFDFTDSVSKEVDLLTDSSGYYYLDNGNRTPVYMSPLDELTQAYNEVTGEIFDFASNIWDSITDKPKEYQGLSFDEASIRADYYQKNYPQIDECEFQDSNLCTPDNILSIAPDLPVPPDYVSSDFEIVVDNQFATGVTNVYDENGDYQKTITDNFAISNTVQDGLTVSSDPTYVGRYETVDPNLVGTVSDPNSFVLSNESTYSDYDPQYYSNKTEDQIKTIENTNQNKLNTSTLEGLINDSNSYLRSIDSTLNNSTGLDATPDPTNNFLNSLPTLEDDKNSIQTALANNSVSFDMDQNTFSVNLFNTTPCIKPSFSFQGKTYELDFKYFCTVLDFMGLLLVMYAYYMAFLIVISARGR